MIELLKFISARGAKKAVTLILMIISVEWMNAAELTFYYRNGSSEVKYYDDATEKLTFTYGAGREIVEITGLEQFPNLNELWLGMTAFIKDYDFLRKLNKLEVLVFQDIRFSDVSFLYEMSALKRLVFQSCKISENIDASKISGLEYFEFTNSQLTEFPMEIREKRNIDTINIAYNSISKIPIADYMDILVIAVGNPIQDINRKNIIIESSGGDIYHVLPEKYRKYVR